jgi:hypothetical protein
MKNLIFIFSFFLCTPMYAQFNTLNIPTGKATYIMPYRDKLLLFMRSGQVYESADTGTTWLAKSNIGGIPNNFYTNDTLIFLHKGAVLHRSTNGGQSWQALNIDTTLQITAAWGRHMMANVTYPYPKKFLVSHDFGTTWQNKSDSLFNGTCQVGGGFCYYGSGSHLGTFYVCSASAKYKSIDGGFTWQPVPEFISQTGYTVNKIYSLYNRILSRVANIVGIDDFIFYKTTNQQNTNWQYMPLLNSSIDYSNNFFTASPYHAIIETKIPYTRIVINYSLDTMQTWKSYCQNCYPLVSNPITFNIERASNTFFHKNKIFATVYNVDADSTRIIYRNLQPFPPILLGTQSNKLILNTVILNWTDTDSTETNYIVERKVNTGTWSVLASLNPNTQIYTDGTAAPNASYQYRVKAVNDFGSSPYLNSANIFTTTEKESTEQAIAIFPNPSENGVFYIQNSNFIPKMLTITNLQGQILLKYNNQLPNSIDLSAYPDGIYFIKADVQTIRIVKNK